MFFNQDAKRNLSQREHGVFWSNGPISQLEGITYRHSTAGSKHLQDTQRQLSSGEHESKTFIPGVLWIVHPKWSSGEEMTDETLRYIAVYSSSCRGREHGFKRIAKVAPEHVNGIRRHIADERAMFRISDTLQLSVKVRVERGPTRVILQASVCSSTPAPRLTLVGTATVRTATAGWMDKEGPPSGSRDSPTGPPLVPVHYATTF